MPLSESQIDRYSRQIILPQVGGRGQEILLGSAVAIVGTGEPTATAALYLAAAGLGRLDLYHAPDESAQPLACLGDDLADLNPDVRLAVSPLPAGDGSPFSWLLPYDAVIADGACEETLVLLNQATAAQHRPLVAGGVRGSLGWLSVTNGPGTACGLCAGRSAWAAAGELCATPLEPTVAGVIGSLQTLELLKLRLGVGTLRSGTWLQFDAATSSLEERAIVAYDDCPVCAPTVRALT